MIFPNPWISPPAAFTIGTAGNSPPAVNSCTFPPSILRVPVLVNTVGPESGAS